MTDIENLIARQNNGVLTEEAKNNFNILLDCSKKSGLIFIDSAKELMVPKVSKFICDCIDSVK